MEDLWVVIVIGPWGLLEGQPVDIYFHDKPVDSEYLLTRYTRGEGQALSFKLDTWDCSTEFAKALKSGEVAEAFKDRIWTMKCGEETRSERHARLVREGRLIEYKPA